MPTSFVVSQLIAKKMISHPEGEFVNVCLVRIAAFAGGGDWLGGLTTHGAPVMVSQQSSQL